jgi:hypothetical protein
MRAVGLKHYALKQDEIFRLKSRAMRSVHPAYIAARAKRLRGASQLCRFLSQSRRNTASMRAMFAQMQGAALKFAR